MPVTYILYSTKLNKYYVGACIDIDRRLYEHNIGHSKFTSTGIPWQLMYTEEFETLEANNEKKIKDMKSRKYIESLIAVVEHPDFNREGPGFESQRDHWMAS